MDNKNIPSKLELDKLIKLFQNERFDETEKLASTLIETFPQHKLSWDILGSVLLRTNRAPEALIIFQKSSEIFFNDPHSLLNLGVILTELERYKEAEMSLKKVINLNAEIPEAYNNLGSIYERLDNLEAAKINFKKAIELKNDFFQAYNNLGLVFKRMDRDQDAINSYKSAILIKPDYADAYNNLSASLRNINKLEEAKNYCEKAIELNSDFFQAYNNLGLTLRKLGNFKDSISSHLKAIYLKPDFAESYNNLGSVYQEIKKFDNAENYYRKAIDLRPDYVEAYNNLAITLREKGDIEESRIFLEKALKIRPNSAELYNNLGYSFMELRRIKESEGCFRKAIELMPKLISSHSNLLYLKSLQDSNPTSYLTEAESFSKIINSQKNSVFSNWFYKKDTKRLKIGFISGDFKEHPVGYFLEGLLRELDKFNLDLYVYSNNFFEDDLTSRLKGLVSSWHEIKNISDEDVAKKIHSEGINILIDLSGHTALNRLSIFTYKPAPIQITWLGYWATTGLDQIDYILGDPYITPLNESNHFVEKIWQLPESFCCFTKPNLEIESCPLPALKNGYITFGCFNNLSKMTEEVIEVRAKILKSIPRSKLLLKNNKMTEEVKKFIIKKFLDNDIDPSRLILEGGSPRDEYLKSYNRVDICLNPFPYGGTTTSVEGLWMGVPIIVKKGNNLISHIGESIACNVGLSDFVTSNNNEYISKAIEISSNLDNLSNIRNKLRKKMSISALMNSSRFADHFHKAMWDMWNLD